VRRLLLLAGLSLVGCAKGGAGVPASVDPAAPAEPAPPPADTFEIAVVNRCSEPWRYYVAAAQSEGATAPSSVVPEADYVQLAPGEQRAQTLRPGDVVWLVNRNGEATAAGFATREEGQGGRIEVQSGCDGIKRVRMAPPGS
jgi:hypothetical protein